MTAFFRATTRFLDRPLSSVSSGLVLLGIVALVTGALLPLWRIQLVAPQYQEGLTLEMYTYKIVGRQRRPGPGRDQHAQPLHRHEADRAGRLRRDDVDAVRHRRVRAARAARGGHRAHRTASSISACCSSTSARSRSGTLRLSAVELRPPSRSARADDDQAVHAGRDRQPADRQLRPDQPADGRHGLHGRCSSPPSPRAIWRVARRRSCDDARPAARAASPPSRPARGARAPRGPMRHRGQRGRRCGAGLHRPRAADDAAGAAPRRATIDVAAGRYTGPFVIDRTAARCARHGRRAPRRRRHHARRSRCAPRTSTSRASRSAARASI